MTHESGKAQRVSGELSVVGFSSDQGGISRSADLQHAAVHCASRIAHSHQPYRQSRHMVEENTSFDTADLVSLLPLSNVNQALARLDSLDSIVQMRPPRPPSSNWRQKGKIGIGRSEPRLWIQLWYPGAAREGRA
jgi:hypothetical protein